MRERSVRGERGVSEEREECERRERCVKGERSVRRALRDEPGDRETSLTDEARETSELG